MRNIKLSPRTALALQALLLMGLALMTAIAAADRPHPAGTVRAAGAAPGLAVPAIPSAADTIGATASGMIRA